MVKRFIDFTVALALVLLMFPVMLSTAIAIICSMGQPILFLQTRPGYRGHPFKVIKFRTMAEQYGPDGIPLPDAQRMQPLGSLLRRLSLDELPQLFNVLKGEMSLVGPRPLLMEYLPLYTPEQMRRHDVKPGITGWAQVCGRNALSWEEKFALDVWYVDHQSFWLDLKILARTISRVWSGSGVAKAGFATTEKFRGSKLPAEEVRNG
jgi:sugar transferase EpsL